MNLYLFLLLLLATYAAAVGFFAEIVDSETPHWSFVLTPVAATVVVGILAGQAWGVS